MPHHPVLKEGDNCWRIAHAERFKLLIDGQSYFPVLREAMLKAERSIFIIGWDVDSRVRLLQESDRREDDTAPATLGELLRYLPEQRPEISIYVLLWDYPLFYAMERELLPGIKLGLITPQQVKVCLDDALPFGSSHHQKVVVIDDSLAFAGGMDLAVRRWDRRDHAPDDPERIDPEGTRYNPFHDMQCVVDGEAAKALAELARERWYNAMCRHAVSLQPAGDRWPESIEPDFRSVDVAIARTFPEGLGQNAIDEVERLHLASVKAAERIIYVENQYLTAESLTNALVERMQAKPGLEVIFVGPEAPGGWVEAHSMGVGRSLLADKLAKAGLFDRVRLFHPVIGDGDSRTSVMVHAKLMIVDDRLLRVGSANLNNRSMGTDSECDLLVEAADYDQSAIIARIRRDLMAEHLGCSVEDVASAEERESSLLRAVDSLRGQDRSLEPIDLERFSPDEVSRALIGFADPREPLPGSEFSSYSFEVPAPTSPWPKVFRLGLLAAAVFGISMLWMLLPTDDWLAPERIAAWLDAMASDWRSVVLLPLVYVAGTLIVFPITVLIAATAIAYGPWSGFGLALAGALLSAAVSYQIGVLLGRKFLHRLIGPRLNRINRSLGRKGVLSVVALRTIPVAPFSLINLACGASQITFRDYLLGTLIGMAPGMAAMVVMGSSLREILLNPGGQNWFLLGGAILLWLLLSIGAQVLVSRWRRSARES